VKDALFFLSGFLLSIASFRSARYALEGNSNLWLCRILTVLWSLMVFVLFPLFLAIGLYGPALILVALNLIIVWAGREHRKEMARKKQKATAVKPHIPLVDVDMPWLNMKEIGFSYFDYEGKVVYQRVDVESCDGRFIKDYSHFYRELRAFELDRIEYGMVIVWRTNESMTVDDWLIAYVEAYSL